MSTAGTAAVRVFGGIDPEKQVVHTGQPFQIICNSFTTPQWTYSGWENADMKENTGVKKKYVYGNMIFVPKASGYNNYGKYHCSGDTSTGEKFFVSSEVYAGGNFIIQLEKFGRLSRFTWGT